MKDALSSCTFSTNIELEHMRVLVAQGRHIVGCSSGLVFHLNTVGGHG